MASAPVACHVSSPGSAGWACARPRPAAGSWPPRHPRPPFVRGPGPAGRPGSPPARPAGRLPARPAGRRRWWRCWSWLQAKHFATDTDALVSRLDLTLWDYFRRQFRTISPAWFRGLDTDSAGASPGSTTCTEADHPERRVSHLAQCGRVRIGQLGSGVNFSHPSRNGDAQASMRASTSAAIFVIRSASVGLSRPWRTASTSSSSSLRP